MSNYSNQSTEFLSKPYLNEMAYVALGVILLFLSSQISIPIEPVPITLQTFGVMLVGLLFERKAAIYSILVYLCLGSMGAPVFANLSGGFHCLMGPTGGYLSGFLIAVAVMASLRQYLSNRNIWHIAFNCLIGTTLILICGIARLSHFVGFKAAIQGGLIPFIFPGLIKAFLLAISVRFLRLGQRNDA